MKLFGEKLNLSHIAAFPQVQCCLRLILNLSEQHLKETPSVNNTMDREIAPESMQCGRSFPHILVGGFGGRPGPSF